ncbi:hypothetical protein V8J82_03425 [Gymnodinialimonas sp. 2305UL16-5]|uniref:hypothetical protein n=1 Tax=Gymnodinialimonas mytili TaxID=3126503 RepID=UPI00309CBF72
MDRGFLAKMNGGAVLLGALALGSAALAEPEGDRAAFDACVTEIWAEEQGNLLAEVAIPAICGADSFEMRQSCGFFGYLPPSGVEACLTEDKALWLAALEQEEATALADGRAGRGAMYDQGLARCTESETNMARLECEVEVVWRTVMEFYAASIFFADVEEAAE